MIRVSGQDGRRVILGVNGKTHELNPVVSGKFLLKSRHIGRNNGARSGTGREDKVSHPDFPLKVVIGDGFTASLREGKRRYGGIFSKNHTVMALSGKEKYDHEKRGDNRQAKAENRII